MNELEVFVSPEEAPYIVLDTKYAKSRLPEELHPFLKYASNIIYKMVSTKEMDEDEIKAYLKNGWVTMLEPYKQSLILFTFPMILSEVPQELIAKYELGLKVYLPKDKVNECAI